MPRIAQRYDVAVDASSTGQGLRDALRALPEMLDFIARTGFEAERVTSLLADWDHAIEAYPAHTTKVVLHRDPLDLA
ncbi:hypothetical protein [Nocardioides sp. NPDC047086]|uniref:hypothetical protein n=1 Tax=Nocardioides sp. NPDC047086 TaxID=3154810 RepID=UPI0033DEC803